MVLVGLIGAFTPPRSPFRDLLYAITHGIA